MTRDAKDMLAARDGRSWKQMLQARLLQNAAVRVEPAAADRVTIHVKTAKPRYMVPPISWIVPVHRERAVVLDRLGTQIWNLCDGRRTVEDVTDAFAERHDLSFHEARVAVTGYASTLVQRGLVVIALPKDAADDEEQ